MHMNMYYRKRTENVLLNALGLGFAFCLGSLFFGIGLLSAWSSPPEGIIVFLFFGLPGLALLVMVARGGMFYFLEKMNHFLLVTEKGLSYSKYGRERYISWADVKWIDWHESKEDRNLLLRIYLKSDKKTSFHLHYVLRREEWNDFYQFLIAIKQNFTINYRAFD